MLHHRGKKLKIPCTYVLYIICKFHSMNKLYTSCSGKRTGMVSMNRLHKHTRTHTRAHTHTHTHTHARAHAHIHNTLLSQHISFIQWSLYMLVTFFYCSKYVHMYVHTYVCTHTSVTGCVCTYIAQNSTHEYLKIRNSTE